MTANDEPPVDDAQQDAHSCSQPTSSKAFLLGHCSAKGDRVEWSEFDQEDAARKRYKELRKSRRSVVLFDEQGNVHHHISKASSSSSSSSGLPIMVSSQYRTDVAAILVARKSFQRRNDDEMHSLVNRNEVEKQVQEGDAPMVPPSRSRIQQWLLKRCIDVFFHRCTVEFFAAGPHRMASLCYFKVRKYPGVRGHVALTLDDAPSRFGSYNSRLSDVSKLLRNYNAKATFFLVGKFIARHTDELVRLLQEGHEFGNHGMMDEAHDNWDSDEAFLEALDFCSNQICNLQRRAGLEEGGVCYFRAPHGKYTRRMESLIQTRNMVNCMCDAYAADPIIEDGNYIANSLTRQARHGGIILLHIPERGFREYCMVALHQLLEGLKRRNLKVVSVGMLEELAMQSKTS